MEKQVPARTLGRELFPPVDPRVYPPLASALDHPFDARHPGTAGHSPVNAWWLAELSMLAYAEPEAIERALQAAHLRLVELLDGNSTQAFVAEGNDFVVVAFRGTQIFLPGEALDVLGGAFADALTDARFLLTPAPAPARGRVHSGFLAALDEIFDRLGDLGSDGRAVWLTGHSLGGALAILAAARLPRVQGVYVFGAPLVGDADFRAGLAARSVRPFRFIHGTDLVTRSLTVPRFPFRSRYEIDGEELAIDRQGRIRRVVPSRRMATVLRGILHFIGSPVGDLIDHAPLFYTIHLWNLLQQRQAREG
jgi:triacylglycerol lipase